MEITNILKNNEITESVVERDVELERSFRTLNRNQKNNLVIIGETGVGKTALVYGMAHEMLNKKSKYYNYHSLSFYEIDVEDLVVGLMDIRKYDEFMLEFSKKISEIKDAIIFIDHLSLLFDSDINFTRRPLAFIKQFTKRKDLHLVTTVSPGDYRKYFDGDPILSKYFEPLRLAEMSIDQTTKVIKHNLPKYEGKYDIKVSQELIDPLTTFAKRYMQDRAMPDKAIDLLDESIAYSKSKNEKILTLDDIKIVIGERTGIPIDNISLSDQEKLQKMEETIKQNLIGQDHAVKIVSEVIRRSRVGLKDPKRPIGSFLFLGPSGVGKTELAKQLAMQVYDDESALVRLDMSEYSESYNVQRLVGAPPGYVGYEEGGQLTNPVWDRPYSLILMDEIEKANRKVFDIFLQVLDEGRLTDGQGRTIDFKHTTIIATSNIGLKKIIDVYMEEGKIDNEKFIKESLMDELTEHFRPEFINRFDEIVVFNPLMHDHLKKIAKIHIIEVRKRLKAKNIRLEVSDQTLNRIATEAFNPMFGARPVRKIIQKYIETPIAKRIISGEITNGMKVKF